MSCTRNKIALYTIISITLLSAVIFAVFKNWDSCQENRGSLSDGLSQDAGLVITGGAISLWEGTRCLSSLQMKRLNFVPKCWGPLQWADSRDIVIEECQLQIDAADLASSFQEIGKTLFHLGQSGLANPELNEPRQGGMTQRGRGATLVLLPPKIEARNFSCRLSYPQGRVVTLKADLATFEPPQTALSLEGNIQVTSGPEACLWAETMEWLPLQEKIEVSRGYKFFWRQGHRSSRHGLFSLAGGNLRQLRLPKAALTARAEPAAVLPPEVMMAAVTGKPPSKRNNTVLSILSLALFQAKTQKEGQSFSAPDQAH
jgi:hypothetical protein